MNNLVLVVDDNLDQREAVVTYLDIEGLQSIEAQNGREALELIKTNKNIKVVISDLHMPNGNGIFLIEEIRKISPVEPCVILLSGQSDMTKEEAISLGALDIFVKPPNMNKMITLVKSMIDSEFIYLNNSQETSRYIPKSNSETSHLF